MQSWKGNTNSYAETDALEADVEVKNFVIANKSATTVTLNVFVKDRDSVNYSIIPKDYQLGAGAKYDGLGLIVLNLEKICLTVSGGTVDYYFSIL